jgi:hypothetical protein
METTEIKATPNFKLFVNSSDEVVGYAQSTDCFDNFTNFFCLPGVWSQQSDTTCITEAQLDAVVVEMRPFFQPIAHP